MQISALSLLMALGVLPAVQGGTKCTNPEGNDGDSYTEGCLKITCKAGVYMTSVDASICCYDRQPYLPNTTTTATEDGCATAVIYCKQEDDVATVVLQVENRCGEYSTVEQVQDIKHLLVKHMEQTDRERDTPVPTSASSTTTTPTHATEDVNVTVPWMSVSPKHPFSVTVTLRSKSNTASGVGGHLQLCSQGRGCCHTDRFVFTAPTVIFLEDHPNCNTFGMDKAQEMSVKVLNEDEVNILIYRFEVVLDDGASYHVLYKKSSTNSTWSQPLPLKIRDITNDQKIMMKINIRNVEGNPSEATYVKGSRIEIKLKGDTRIGCKTNPLPWPTKDGKVNLNDIESLGTCFTYSIIEAGENLLVRYQEPSNTPFTVSKIVLKTFENQNYGWTVRQPTGQWSNAEFDDDY